MDDTNATIDTIAQHCGLSRTTVSAVLRGDAARYRISATTADRVRAMAEAQDWRPNFFARSLNRKRTDTIGVLFPDVFERFMGETVRGIEDALAAADFRMLLSTSRFDPEEELRAIQAFAYRGVDGLIIAPYAPFRNPVSLAPKFGFQAATLGIDQAQPEAQPGTELAPLVKAIGNTSCVLIDRVPESLEPLPATYGVVVQADRAAAMEATLALAKAAGNHEPIGFAGFDLAASSLSERRAGYRQATLRLGIEPVEILLYERNPASKDLERALDKALPRTRAWIASTEGIGLKLAALLTQRGYRIGENAWVARFGTDQPFLPTPLISLRQPQYKLGFQAAGLLLSLMGMGIGVLNTVASNANIKLRNELEMELVLPERGGKRRKHLYTKESWMKRSEINALMEEATAIFSEYRYCLPPWAYWRPSDWKGRGDEIREIKENMMGWDVTDFGSGNFAKRGLFLFTVRNGNPKRDRKPYAEKIMIVKVNQETPMHFHYSKMEDIINRGGGKLVIQLYNATKDDKLADTALQVSVDGVRRTVQAGGKVVLEPGESICLEQRCYHSFWAEGKPVLTGEVSMANDDMQDNHFLENCGRFPAIEEDTEALHLLVSDYAAMGGKS